MTKTSKNRNNTFRFPKNKRWPWGCLLFLCLACREKVQPDLAVSAPGMTNRMDSIHSIIKSGDLIFRNGTDEVSRAARSFNRIDTSFSHCGIVLAEHDSLFVYHSLGGRYNPEQKLRRDPLENFYADPEIDRLGVYRYDLQPGQHDSLVVIVQRYYQAGLKFDMYFNFLSDDKMYCSEFVFKCLDKSLSGQLYRHIRPRKWPFGVSPDDLFLHPRSRLIKRVDFTR